VSQEGDGFSAGKRPRVCALAVVGEEVMMLDVATEAPPVCPADQL
jgi:hypothetical protein